MARVAGCKQCEMPSHMDLPSWDVAIATEVYDCCGGPVPSHMMGCKNFHYHIHHPGKGYSGQPTTGSVKSGTEIKLP